MAKFIIEYTEEDDLPILLEIIKTKVEQGYIEGSEGPANWHIEEEE